MEVRAAFSLYYCDEGVLLRITYEQIHNSISLMIWDVAYIDEFDCWVVRGSCEGYRSQQYINNIFVLQLFNSSKIIMDVQSACLMYVWYCICMGNVPLI